MVVANVRYYWRFRQIVLNKLIQIEQLASSSCLLYVKNDSQLKEIWRAVEKNQES